MNAIELIEALSRMPPHANVKHVWDGVSRTEIHHVWLSRDGEVMTADAEEVVYDTGDRPVDAPTMEEDLYWKTPRVAS
jgi:hypothetical protein